MPVNMVLNVVLAMLAATLVSANTAAKSDTASQKREEPKKQPNFIFIITDDQDLHLNSLAYQPIVRKQIGEQGTTFSKHFCTISLCCPSRVSLLTGKLAHNTNVTDVAPPYGGYPKFVSQGLNDKYLPVWLQSAGYNTYYTGKLMNGHSSTNWNTPYPAGWNGTNYLIDPGTYVYYNGTFQSDQTPPANRPGEYSTDVVRDTSLGFLDKASKAGNPFFIGVAPIGPHAEAIFPPGTEKPYFAPPVPAERHKNLFPDVKVPRGVSFNPDAASGASWVSKLPKLNSTLIASMDDYYRARLQSLVAVDELVGAIMSRVEALGLLDNTYIIYTSDNGFHIAQHRMLPGKSCAYEEDINIPFMIRGPGIPKNQEVDFVTSHTDIAPTIFKLAGMTLRDDFDGTPMPLVEKEMREAASSPKHDHVSVEYWGVGIAEGNNQIARMGVNGSYTTYPNNTYKAIRVVGKTYNLAYTVWCTNEHELYDMKDDPQQMKNLASGSPRENVIGISLSQVLARLDAMMMVMKSCKGAQCTLPWLTLHPKGNVNSLAEALNGRYDSFYAMQPKVSFTSCEPGYIVSAEGPQVPLMYQTENWNDWH